MTETHRQQLERLVRLSAITGELDAAAIKAVLLERAELVEALKETTNALSYWLRTLSTPITDSECAAVTNLERIISTGRAAMRKAESE